MSNRNSNEPFFEPEKQEKRDSNKLSANDLPDFVGNSSNQLSVSAARESCIGDETNLTGASMTLISSMKIDTLHSSDDPDDDWFEKTAIEYRDAERAGDSARTKCLASVLNDRLVQIGNTIFRDEWAVSYTHLTLPTKA